MNLGRELDENLGRVGRRENEEKSEGHERECTIYRPSNWVDEATLTTQRSTRGKLFRKRDRRDWPTNSLVTRGV